MHTYTIKHNGYTLGTAKGKRAAVDTVRHHSKGQGLWEKVSGELRFHYVDKDGVEGHYTIERECV